MTDAEYIKKLEAAIRAVLTSPTLSERGNAIVVCSATVARLRATLAHS